MLKIYGSMLCPDCVECRRALDEKGVAYEFLDFGQSLAHLKAFLKHRDGSPLFDDSRREGKIGIPCLEKEDGAITLDWTEFL